MSFVKLMIQIVVVFLNIMEGSSKVAKKKICYLENVVQNGKHDALYLLLRIK